MSHDPHLGFIIAAYAFTGLIIGGMTVAIVTDYVNLQRALASFARQEKQLGPEQSNQREASALQLDQKKVP